MLSSKNSCELFVLMHCRPGLQQTLLHSLVEGNKSGISRVFDTVKWTEEAAADLQSSVLNGNIAHYCIIYFSV